MDRLDPVLPFLRPRSAEITWYMALLAGLLCASLIAMIALYLIRWRRRRKQFEKNFSNQASARGLDRDQIRFLLRLARKKRMNNPLLLLTSVYVFDRHVGQLATHLAEQSPEDPTLDLISSIRARLGFDEIPADQALRSTRQLPEGLTLMVWTEETEAEECAPWIVVGRDERAITTAPLLKDGEVAHHPLHPGELLAARFWREGDTEYRFSTEVLTYDPRTLTAQLRHVDRIERLQQRDFYRLHVHFPILFFSLPEEESADEAEDPEQLLAQMDRRESGEMEAEDETPDLTLTGALRIRAEVHNLSAGGLYVVTGDPIPPSSRLLVDPNFEGPFPLAGLSCEILHIAQAPAGEALQLRFVDLPPARESEIVRLIYQQQIHRLHDHGSPPHAPTDLHATTDGSDAP